MAIKRANMNGEAALTIRATTDQDVPVIVALLYDQAEHHRAGHEASVTSGKLRSALFGSEPALHGVVAERESNLVGFALFYFIFSPWLGRKGLYLEDIYIRPEGRGSGTGRALMKRVAEIAIAADCARLDWRVAKWNEAAIAFYSGLGGKAQEDSTLYRLDEEALLRLSQI